MCSTNNLITKYKVYVPANCNTLLSQNSCILQSLVYCMCVLRGETYLVPVHAILLTSSTQDHYNAYNGLLDVPSLPSLPAVLAVESPSPDAPFVS